MKSRNAPRNELSGELKRLQSSQWLLAQLINAEWLLAQLINAER